MGFVNPPLQITAKGQTFAIAVLNERGKIMLPPIAKVIAELAHIEISTHSATLLSGIILPPTQRFPEELRSKQPSIFSILRAINDLFYNPEENHLGLYGAFGYDLAFQFEPIKQRIERAAEQRDLVLFLPDEVFIVDHQKETALVNRYEFQINGESTQHLARAGSAAAYVAAANVEKNVDHQPGEYAEVVRKAKQAFKRGDLFEAVPGQIFFEPCAASPSELFDCLRVRNPSPYSFLMNLGEAEYLVGTSPEMYVRVTGKRVETCPISGTIARGKDALQDAQQILNLLNSAKDAAELTMCTDVDRNDKSRICEPGSVRVIGRRQTEMYSRLIHTVDHVEGTLRDGYDALDAFLTHAWAVTVTGAPKMWAMQFIEDNERSPRLWYGGAVGRIGFNGDMNTGLTIRTVRIKDGVAAVRVGATLLYDSVPEEEEQETHLKASALLDAIRYSSAAKTASVKTPQIKKQVRALKNNMHVLLVDHQDSFVHTLANYLGQTGAKITTLRSGFSAAELQAIAPDLMVLSPGPGRPSDFNVSKTIAMALDLQIPIFGVCLGLQALVEYYGGTLNVLDYPMHGKTTNIRTQGGQLFKDLPENFAVGLYHSLYADKATFPRDLKITAESDNGIIMAIEHTHLPIWAVQFHPESILTLQDNMGHRMLENVVRLVG
jgi:anthranilate synthase